MKSKTLARTDAAAALLLLLWAGMVLGFGLLMAPLLFRILPSRDLAGLVAGKVVARLDLAAWIAFGGAIILVQGGRWILELREADVLGPLRLWGAAAVLALLMCFTSGFIISPKLHTIRARMNGPVESFAPDQPDRVAYGKAHGISRQLMGLRLLLALALAAGLLALPRSGPTPEIRP
ncbi:MAG: DUF4149 domain-containing protein [Holophaga sp.]|nr:DUF4149 domain-containing protein [Holophaga sp.]